MSKGLVIIESPGKAKAIQKYLGKGFVVEASFGHVKDLPKSTLGVDIDNDFETEYIVIPGKEKVVAKLKKLALSGQHLPGARPRSRGRSHRLASGRRTGPGEQRQEEKEEEGRRRTRSHPPRDL